MSHKTVVQKTFSTTYAPRGEDIAQAVADHDLYGWNVDIKRPDPTMGQSYYRILFTKEEEAE